MTLCIYHDDLDGQCSAAIVKKALGAKVITYETNYDKPLPPDGLIFDNDIVIVDFSYPPVMMAELQDKAKSIIYIDRHRTAMFYPYDHIPGLRDFKDKSQAACELTWDYYFPMVDMPLSVKYIGDYDKWAHHMVGSIPFHEGAKLIDTTPESRIWDELLSCHYTTVLDACDHIMASGETVMVYKERQNKKLCDSFGYETFFHSPAFVVNQSMFSSLGFGAKIKEYPICIAYVFDGSKYTVSLYSETVDVGSIAKIYGGGGHKGAAGFTCIELPFFRLDKED